MSEPRPRSPTRSITTIPWHAFWVDHYRRGVARLHRQGGGATLEHDNAQVEAAARLRSCSPARLFWPFATVCRTVASAWDLSGRRGRPRMSPQLPVRLQAGAARLGRPCSHVRSRSHRRARESDFAGSGPCETAFGADDGAFV